MTTIQVASSEKRNDWERNESIRRKEGSLALAGDALVEAGHPGTDVAALVPLASRGARFGSGGGGRLGIVVALVIINLSDRGRRVVRLGRAAWLGRGARLGGCSRRVRRALARASKSGDWRTGERVLEATVKDFRGEDAWVSGAVRAWEAHSLGGDGLALTALDVHLEAAGVKLGTALTIGKMQGNDLVADDVLAVFELWGDRKAVLGAEFHCQTSESIDERQENRQYILRRSRNHFLPSWPSCATLKKLPWAASNVLAVWPAGTLAM
jgi:hypothetical protein